MAWMAYLGDGKIIPFTNGQKSRLNAKKNMPGIWPSNWPPNWLGGAVAGKAWSRTVTTNVPGH